MSEIKCPNCGGNTCGVVSEFAPVLNIGEEESEMMVGEMPDQRYCFSEGKVVNIKEQA